MVRHTREVSVYFSEGESILYDISLFVDHTSPACWSV